MYNRRDLLSTRMSRCSCPSQDRWVVLGEGRRGRAQVYKDCSESVEQNPNHCSNKYNDKISTRTCAIVGCQIFTIQNLQGSIDSVRCWLVSGSLDPHSSRLKHSSARTGPPPPGDSSHLVARPLGPIQSSRKCRIVSGLQTWSWVWIQSTQIHFRRNIGSSRGQTLCECEGKGLGLFATIPSCTQWDAYMYTTTWTICKLVVYKLAIAVYLITRHLSYLPIHVHNETVWEIER